MVFSKKNPGSLLAIVALAGTVGLAQPAAAYHLGETFKADYKTFTIHGAYSKRACSAQANLKSEGGQNVGFAIYWRPGKDIYLLVSHPAFSGASAAQKVTFVFGNGQKVVFPMKAYGNQLQVPIGFGPRGSSFYDALQKNDVVRIEMPGVGDSVTVALKEKNKVEDGLMLCREFLH